MTQPSRWSINAYVRFYKRHGHSEARRAWQGERQRRMRGSALRAGNTYGPISMTRNVVGVDAVTRRRVSRVVRLPEGVPLDQTNT